MSAGTEQTLDVRVVGIVRGREIDAPAQVALDAGALVLNWAAAAAWRLAFDGIEGVNPGTTSLTVYLRDHDVLELTGTDAMRPFGLALIDRACTVPELTRGLRHLGAVPRHGGRHAMVTASGDSPLQRAHDAWFAPLLAARRAVHGVTDPSRQITLLDAAALAESMTEAAARIAATLAPSSAADQRAIEAAIEDEAAPMFDALQRMRVAGEAVRGGATDTRFADWRRWMQCAAQVFAAADDAWANIGEIIAES